jgi:hypothetical protein
MGELTATNGQRKMVKSTLGDRIVTQGFKVKD